MILKIMIITSKVIYKKKRIIYNHTMQHDVMPVELIIAYDKNKISREERTLI